MTRLLHFLTTMNPWVYIVIGTILVASGGIIGTYGWHKLKSIDKNYTFSEERIQQMAEENGITRTALKNFFKIMKRDQVPLENLQETLSEFAKRYKELEAELKDLPASIPTIMDLKQRASDALGKGNLDQVEQLILDLKNLPDFSEFRLREEKKKKYKHLFEESKKALVTPLERLREKIPPLEDITISLGENMALTGTLGVNPCGSCPLEGAGIVLCGPGKRKRPLMLTSLGLCDYGEEKTSLMAHHVVKIENVTPPEIVWSDSRDVILGQANMKIAIDQMIQGLEESFNTAFKRYSELIKKHKDTIE